jgi:addiction module HigA family antidote
MRQPPPHPGEIFGDDFLRPNGISLAEAARRMGMVANRLDEIVVDKHAVTAETALLFEALTGASAQFWLHLQADYDLFHAQRTVRVDQVEPIPRPHGVSKFDTLRCWMTIGVASIERMLELGYQWAGT